VASNKHKSKSAISSAMQLEKQKERCWKALLLDPTEEMGIVVSENYDEPSSLKTEWDIVLDHFENSRSKKVLTIIQQ
jgi:hypothetical protein